MTAGRTPLGFFASLRMTRYGFLCFLCFLWPFLPACKKRETDVERGIREQVLHRGLSADLSGLDPHLETGLPEINVMSALFEGLVGEHPETGAPVPAVAERWETSADGLTWTFHLRANARWSNGVPVTAHDFVNSIKRVLTKSLGADNAALLFVLANAESWQRGDLTDFDRVGAQAVNDHTLRLTLAHPAPYLLTLLSHPIWYPVYLPALEKAGGIAQRGTKWTDVENFVGNGPFVLKRNQRGQVIIVDKSPNYWDAATVRLNSIHFHPAEDREGEERAFRAGQLHITEALPVGKVDTYRREHPGELRISPFLDTYFYRLNTTRPGLDDKRVRRALSLALDRRAITEKIVRGGQQPARAFTPPDAGGYTPPDLLREDQAEAQRLLTAAGYPGGRGLPPLEILINSSGNHRVIAEAVQQMWRRLGVQVELNNMEQASLFAKRRALDYSVLRSEWAADFADPKSFLDVFRGGSSNNHTGWNNLRYDALLRDADHAADPAARHELLRQAESVLLEELPIIPLYHFTTVRLVHPAVRGWHPLPLDRHPYKHVWLEAGK
jgi:oligopeptide transport system substrate-binding protein